MLESPFHFEDDLTPEQYQMLGKLSLSWSTIDHVIGNCLKVALRLSDQEATKIVFPMGAEMRFTKLVELSQINTFHPTALRALRELTPTMRALRSVRNTVAHSIVFSKPDGEAILHNRSKGVNHTISQVLSTEELTNYAAQLVLTLRLALGFRPGEHEHRPLPGRPPVPVFLRSYFQAQNIQNEAERRSRRRPSRGSI
jgi:hypothetical protein